MKRITLSADGDLIETARWRAAEEGTTLNAQFRLWLSGYVGRCRQADTALETIQALPRIHRWTGMDGVRTSEGGEGVTGAMIRARIWVDGR